LADLVRRRWESDLSSGLPRRDRLGCDYEAYLPDPLAGRQWHLDAATAADVVDAEVAISRLDREAAALRGTEVLARILLRAESVASSRIEGLEVGGRRLLQAEAARGFDEPTTDVTAAEVLANVDAMVRATELVGAGDPITVASLLEVRERLLTTGHIARHGGKLRTEQNWIGGSGYNPCSATFVPPPPEAVPDLLEDLCEFCADDTLPTVAQAAIAHAQFEAIHPFVDGNGRTGRALIHMVLRRRGLVTGVLPPVSLILATWSRDYLAALDAAHYVGPPDSDDARAATDSWVALFAAACSRACADAVDFEQRLDVLREDWLGRVGPVRADSALERILRLLPAAPVLTVRSAAALADRSLQATNAAINRLVEANILRQVTVGRRNRAFEAPEAIEAFAYLERRLASPAGDTLISPPRRRVPQRPSAPSSRGNS